MKLMDMSFPSGSDVGAAGATSLSESLNFSVSMLGLDVICTLVRCVHVTVSSQGLPFDTASSDPQMGVASAIALSEAFKLSSATFYLSPPGTILAFNIGGLFSWCMT